MAGETQPAEPPTPGKSSHRVRYAWIWLLVILGAGLSLLMFLLARRSEARNDEERFQRQISIYSSAFDAQSNGVEDVLRTLRALFNQNPDLSRRMFYDTIHDLAIRTEGLQALAWAPRVPESEREAIERRIRSSEFPTFQFTDGDLIHVPDEFPQRAGSRPEYFPLMLVEPQAGNEPAIGYDLGSVPQVRRILDRARDTGLISASARVSLRYEREVRNSSVIAVPVFHPGFRPATREERLKQFRGCVFAVVVFRTAMQQLRNRIPGVSLDVMLLDETPGEPVEVLEVPADPKDPNRRLTEAGFRASPTSEQSATVGGRKWKLLFRRSAGWNPGPDRWHSYTLLTGGLVLTLLLARYLLVSMRRALEIEEVVAERTSDLARTNVLLQDEVRERERAQSDLARDRGLLRTLIDRLPDSVYVTDSSGRYVMINQTHCRLLNAGSESECVGRAVAETGPPELARILADGSEEVLRSGEPSLNREEKVTLADGRSAVIVLSRLPLLKAGGEVDGLVVLCRDVSEARAVEHEKDRLSRRLQETQKLESLGILAGGIAHDFNNLLTAVLGNAELARVEMREGVRAEYLGQIEAAGARAADLCKQMLAYSGKGRFEVRRIDLSALVEETTELLRLSVSKKAETVLQLSQDHPAVSGDPTQLRQILMNLVINASEAIGEAAGSIRISTGIEQVDHEFLASTVTAPDLPSGRYVCLAVSDNGCGMDRDTRERIFDPFFSTKFAGRGLGLAAVLGIVRGHKGAIQVQSEPGEGATFKLYLPPDDGPPERDTARAATEVAWRGQGVILVVDDEEPVRSVATGILQHIGFTVETAQDGLQAVEAFAANPHRYAAVLLDLTMPRMDGEEAFHEMRRIRPDTRVLLMSGYSPQEAIDRFAGRGLDGFVQKPFSAFTLRTSIRALLEPTGDPEQRTKK